MAREDLRRGLVAFVLVLVGATALVGLFSQAGAVTFDIAAQGDEQTFTTGQEAVNFTVDVNVSSDERLPIEAIRAELDDLTTDAQVASASCPDPIPDGCENLGGNITAIGFEGTTPGDQKQHGYGECDEICLVIQDEEYELNVSAGYGPADVNLTISFKVTVNASLLGPGSYGLTFVTETGSDTLPTIESDPHTFDVIDEVTSGEEIDASSGDTFAVTTDDPDDQVERVDTEFDGDCTNCSIELTETDEPPATLDATTGDEQAAYFLEVEVTSDETDDPDNTVSKADIRFSLTREQLGDADPQDVVLRHFPTLTSSGDNLDTQVLSDLSTNPDTIKYEAETDGFSTFVLIVNPTTPSTPGGGGGGPLTPGIREGRSFGADAGDSVLVDSGLFGTPVEEVLLEFGRECDSCSLEVEDTDESPEDLGDPPGYAEPLESFEARLEPSSEALDNVWIETALEDSSVEPEHVTVLRGTDTGWQPPSELRTTTDDGALLLNASFPGLSPFVVAADEQPPTIEAIEPADGETVVQKPTITFTVQDNRGLDLAASSVHIQDRDLALERVDPQAECVQSPCRIEATLEGANLLVGETELEATFVDVSGLSADETHSYEVAAQLSQPSVCAQPDPGPFEVVAEAKPTIELVYDEGLEACDAESPGFTMAVDGTPVAPEVSDWTARFVPATPLSEGQHHVEAGLITDDGLERSFEWTFSVDLTPPEVVEVSPEDGESLEETRPTIEASLEDAVSRVDARTVTLAIDGQTVEPSFEDGTVTYTVEEELDDGEHEVELSVEDRGGNVETHSWSFETETALSAWVWLVVFVGSIVLLSAAGYVAYRQRMPEE